MKQIQNSGNPMMANQTVDGKLPANNRKANFVYESANVSFDSSQFLWELLVNALHPLFVWYAPVPHIFWPIKSFNTFVFIHGTSILVLLTLVSTFTSSVLDKSDCIIPMMVFLMHRTMVAVKYGCYTRSEYK